MKFIRTAIVATIITTFFLACSKDRNAPAFSIEGSWSGKIGTGSANPSGQYALNIKPGGSLDRIGSNGTVSASGTWTLQGNAFTAVYFYANGTAVDVAGTVEKATNKITGTWSNNGNETGTFYLNK